MFRLKADSMDFSKGYNPRCRRRPQSSYKDVHIEMMEKSIAKHCMRVSTGNRNQCYGKMVTMRAFGHLRTL